MSAISMHLVTGYAGSGHIRSEDWARLNEGIFGNKNYVLNEGNKFSYEKTTNNQLKINPGEAVVGGRHVRFAENVPAILDFASASQGATRTDSIVIRLRYNDDGTEEAELDTVTGTKVVDSDYSDISSSNKEKTMVLYHVTIGASGITKVEQAFSLTKNLNDVAEVDLSDYVKKTDYAGVSKIGVIKVLNSYGLDVDSTGLLRGSSVSEATYQTSNTRLIMTKGTFDEIIDGVVKNIIAPVDATITWASGEEPKDGSGNPLNNAFFRKSNGIVYVFVQSASKAHAAGNTICTIPASHRPKKQCFIPIVNIGSGNYAFGTASVNTDGTVKIGSLSQEVTGGRFYLNGTYSVD